MKRLVILLSIVFCFGIAYAQDATLSAPVPLSVPTANHIQISNIEIMPVSKIMRVTYRWLDANKRAIVTTDGMKTDRIWSCTESAGEPVANCTDVGTPYPCCTGVGTGTNCKAPDTSFSDIFGFKMRTEDVGKSIGIGLRTLIVAKMKAQIPALTNVTITFAD